MSKANATIGKAFNSANSFSSRKHIESSLTADKFSIRGNKHLFSEITRLGIESGRSTNSEIVAAILEELSEHKKTNALIRALKADLGDETSTSVLDTLKEFDFNPRQVEAKFSVRIPPNVRDTIREMLQSKLVKAETGQHKSMNTWFIETMIRWIGIQHKISALLIAAMKKDNHE